MKSVGSARPLGSSLAVVALMGCLASGVGWAEASGSPLRVALAFSPLGVLRAVAAGGTVILGGTTRFVVEIVQTEADLARGLSGRPALAPGHGMLFVFTAPGRHGIWMPDMRFPIDILWIQRERVVDIKREAPVPTPGVPLEVYRPREDADLVLEVPSGFSDAQGIRIGDAVEVRLK